MTSFIAACGSGRSTSFIPAVPAAWSVTTIAFTTFLLDQRRPPGNQKKRFPPGDARRCGRLESSNRPKVGRNDCTIAAWPRCPSVAAYTVLPTVRGTGAISAARDLLRKELCLRVDHECPVDELLENG